MLKKKFITNTSLAARLMLFMVLPLSVSVLGLGSLVLAKLEGHVESQMQNDVELVARAVQGPLSRSLERDRGGTVQETLESVFDIGRIYGAYLYNERGEVMAAAGTFSTNRQLEDRISRVVESERRTGEYGEVDGRNVYSYFVPLKGSDGRVIGLLQIARRESEITEYLGEIRGMAAIYLLAGTILLSGVILIGYHGALGRSLGSLRKAMSRVREGDRHHRAPTEEGPREIAELARSMNRMLDSIVAAEQKIAEGRAAQADLTEKLKSSQKLAALGEMAAGVAHELGTPLSVLDGKAQRALRPSRQPEEVRTYLNEIRQDVRGMENVVRQLLEFGRPAGTRHHEIRTDQIADRARLGAVQAVGGSAGRLRLRGPVPGPLLSGDPVRIELALKNLLQNALQASPNGCVNVDWEEDGGVHFTISDEGPGISPEMREKIFTPFFTTKGDRRGRGLGLAIVQQVVTEHRGRVEITDSTTGGACFKLYFPASGTTRNETNGSPAAPVL